MVRDLVITGLAGVLLAPAFARADKAPTTKTPVCISAETKDASGFGLPTAKDAEDVFKKLGENISKRDGLTLVPAGEACVVQVVVLGYQYEETGGTSLVRQNPFNPYQVTGSKADKRMLVMARLRVGEYQTELAAPVNQQVFGQSGESAKALSKAVEKWTRENAEPIKAQLAKSK